MSGSGSNSSGWQPSGRRRTAANGSPTPTSPPRPGRSRHRRSGPGPRGSRRPSGHSPAGSWNGSAKGTVFEAAQEYLPVGKTAYHEHLNALANAGIVDLVPRTVRGREVRLRYDAGNDQGKMFVPALVSPSHHGGLLPECREDASSLAAVKNRPLAFAEEGIPGGLVQADEIDLRLHCPGREYEEPENRIPLRTRSRESCSNVSPQ